jgi:glycine/D-amino acid oxidase-like deaminating enzyme
MIWDAVVLGAGLYGCKVALELAALRLKVVLLDPNPMFEGATRVNQQRIHAGFHYPRSITTAETAARNYFRFLIDHAEAVDGNDRHLYCIAADSKVGPEEYERVLDSIGADYRRVYTPSYFAPNMIAQCYETHEKSFNIDKLRALLNQQLKIAGVERVTAPGSIVDLDDDHVVVQAGNSLFEARYVFNCTYAKIDTIVPIRTKLVKEHVEVPIIRIPGPHPFIREDVTVMDGPYFSVMSYPPRVDFWASALTHVKHGRHHVWSPPEPEPEWNPEASSKVSQMLLDAARYIPMMAQAKHLSSMYTTRVLLAESSDDDGRPVLVEYAEESPRIISVLGSKFTSCYDIIDFIRVWAQHAI